MKGREIVVIAALRAVGKQLNIQIAEHLRQRLNISDNLGDLYKVTEIKNNKDNKQRISSFNENFKLKNWFQSSGFDYILRIDFDYDAKRINSNSILIDKIYYSI